MNGIRLLPAQRSELRRVRLSENMRKNKDCHEHRKIYAAFLCNPGKYNKMKEGLNEY